MSGVNFTSPLGQSTDLLAHGIYIKGAINKMMPNSTILQLYMWSSIIDVTVIGGEGVKDFVTAILRPK